MGQKLKIIFLLSQLVFCFQLGANDSSKLLPLPDDPNFEIAHYSFRLSNTSRSITGKRESYQFWLQANGDIYFQGLYRGIGGQGCNDQGGEVNSGQPKETLDIELRRKLIIAAIKSHQENVENSKEDKNKNGKKIKRGPGNQGRSLMLEVGDRISLIQLSHMGPHTREFLQLIQTASEELFAKKESRRNVLKIEIGPAKLGQAEVSIINQGLKPQAIALPSIASEHFSYFFEEKNFPVRYVKPPIAEVKTLKPDEKISFLIKLPNENAKGGILIFDNHPEVEINGKLLKNKPSVRLCGPVL